jgi:hypothetical protein
MPASRRTRRTLGPDGREIHAAYIEETGEWLEADTEEDLEAALDEFYGTNQDG